MNRLLLLALCVCLVGIGTLSRGGTAPAAASQATVSVVGGIPSTPGAYPWMAALVPRPPYTPTDLLPPGPGFRRASAQASRARTELFCGGTLIAPDRILTAGHCAAGQSPRKIDVLIGDGDLNASPQLRVHVKGIATHPGYRPARFVGPRNDIAVLELATPVDVPPLPLIDAARAAQLPPGSVVRALGRGLTSPKVENFNTSSYLREVDLSLIADATCEQSFPRAFHGYTQLCAGGAPGRGVCYGDSGGPLLVGSDAGWLQLGVASSLIRPGDCTGRLPQLFARLSTLGGFALSPDPTFAPYNLRRPKLRGDLRVGATLHCRPGLWNGRPIRFRYSWVSRKVFHFGGERIAFDHEITKAHRPFLRVTRKAVRGAALCEVRAANRGGYAFASSRRARPPRIR